MDNVKVAIERLRLEAESAFRKARELTLRGETLLEAAGKLETAVEHDLKKTSGYDQNQ